MRKLKYGWFKECAHGHTAGEMVEPAANPGGAASESLLTAGCSA